MLQVNLGCSRINQVVGSHFQCILHSLFLFDDILLCERKLMVLLIHGTENDKLYHTEEANVNSYFAVW